MPRTRGSTHGGQEILLRLKKPIRPAEQVDRRVALSSQAAGGTIRETGAAAAPTPSPCAGRELGFVSKDRKTGENWQETGC